MVSHPYKGLTGGGGRESPVTLGIVSHPYKGLTLEGYLLSLEAWSDGHIRDSPWRGDFHYLVSRPYPHTYFKTSQGPVACLPHCFVIVSLKEDSM